ncbi:MAG: acetate kinase [Caldisericia bacterium]|nr:acetate kinase [Caldisericia bacterium]
MKILVLNCGSSSIKYKLYEMDDETELASGLAERIGSEEAGFRYKNLAGADKKETLPIRNHADGIKIILQYMTDPVDGVIKNVNEITACGHRIVHGGEKFSSSVKITQEVIDEVKRCIPLAPLHNPPNLTGVLACQDIMQETPQIAVFDTAYHQTLPNYAFMYALPSDLYKQDRVRRYGFHGTSHRFVALECSKMLGKAIETLKIITCHLGNGSSIAAVNQGKSIDTTMGFTPLEGIMMGTRSGTIDPAIVFFLMREKHLTMDQVDNLLNKQSGFLGVSNISNDLRDITKAAKEGNELASLSLKMCSYQLKKFVGSYIAAMNGVDAIVFTGGVGENTEEIRESSMSHMEYFGIQLDHQKNITDMKKSRIISTDTSPVKIMVIFTNEEIMIARDTLTILQQS